MNPLQDPRLLVWLFILLLGSLMRTKGAALDTSYAPQANGAVRKIAVGRDGKALVAGHFTVVNGQARPGLARLNADGTLDTRFDPAIAPGSVVSAIALRPDGAMVIAGNLSINGLAAHLAALNGDGSVSRTWDAQNGPSAAPAALAFDPDGRLLVGGGFRNFAGVPATYLVRLTGAGEFDANFTPPLEPSFAMEAGVSSLKVQADGSLVIGGVFKVGGATAKLVRLTANGSLDTSFAPDQTKVLYVHALAGAGGNILAGGQEHYSGFCRQYGAQGAAERQLETPSGVVWAVAASEDGSMLVGGDFRQVNGTASQNLARVASSGALDRSFNIGTDGAVLAIGALSGGEFLIGGSFTSVDGKTQPYLARVRTQAGPVFARVTCNAQSHFCTILKAEPGASYAIESSTDLKNWVLLKTVTPATAEIEVEAPSASTGRQQFFRARKL
ncbi:MAG TPA: hypothetical protein VEH27_07810 [Methylomirabilota bacterium]|nr:hypothetical protein [Methylomirabilota bacterium]